MATSIKNYRIKASSQKVRLVINMIRKKKISKALDILSFINKKTAFSIKKILESAIADADYNEGIDVDNLKISKIFVNNGLSVKRISPRAKGRADHIIKRSSYITLILSDN